MDWKAKWIWYPQAEEEVDCYFLFGRKFHINAVKETWLNISAWTQYQVYLNGEFVGRGPAPSTPKDCCYDTFEVSGFLREGENTILALAHNFGVGVHWQPVARGGFICQLEAENLLICSDKQFLTRRADWFLTGSPRMMWSCQFLESVDLSRREEGWERMGGKNWRAAEVMGDPGMFPFLNLQEREIPMLQSGRKDPEIVLRYTFQLQGLQCVSFRPEKIPAGEELLFLESEFSVQEKEDTILYFSCDDACRVFLNGEMVLVQEYEDEFVRHAVWNGRHEYEQFHHGVGMRKETAEISLLKGRNRLQVIVDKILSSWGFTVGIADKVREGQADIGGGENPPVLRDLKYSGWKILRTERSNGLKNSMHGYNRFPEPVPPGQKIIIDGYDTSGLTDYTKLMRSECRISDPEGWRDGGEERSFREGEGGIYDFGTVSTGFVTLLLEAEQDAILDLSYTNVLSDDLRPSVIWQMRYTDRIYIPGRNSVPDRNCVSDRIYIPDRNCVSDRNCIPDRDYSSESVFRYETFERREARYLHISVRKGRVTVKKAGIHTVNYPADRLGNFTCSSQEWNHIWDVSVYTSKILMQEGYQDCLRRECGVHNTRSFIHASSAAYYCFGDSRLIRKNLLDGLRTQEDSGWFSSHGPTDTNADESTQMLWWFEALEGYLMRTGDREFLLSVYERVKCVLRYFSHQENKNCLLDCRNETREVRGRCCYIDDAVNGYPYTGLSDGILLGFNVLYYSALCSFSRLARWLGREKDGDFYARKAENLKTAVQDVFWDEKADIFRDYADETGTLAGRSSQSVLLAALYCGICRKDQEKRVMDYVLDEMKTPDGDFAGSRLTFGFYYFFLKCLIRRGEEKKAAQLIDDYYGRWLKLGATTFGEYFELRDLVGKDRITIEYNTHNYGTSLHELFYTEILGIQPKEYGFGRVVISPHPLGLTRASGQVFTVKGMLRVSWNCGEDGFYIEADAPQGMELSVEVPEGYTKAYVSVNGKERNLWKET